MLVGHPLLLSLKWNSQKSPKTLQQYLKRFVSIIIKKDYILFKTDLKHLEI